MRPLPTLALAASALACATPPDSSADLLPGSSVQGWLGAAEWSEEDFHYATPDPGDPTTGIPSDVVRMPTAGFAFQQALSGRRLRIGYETGLAVSWANDDARITDPGGAVLVDVDRELLLGDAFVGVYATTLLGRRWRAYGAAGPLLLYGAAHETSDTLDLRADAFGTGAYARAGLEVRVGAFSYLGVGVRALTGRLDFDSGLPDFDVDGVQAFVTFTGVASGEPRAGFPGYR
jgi:hypothetical protein